MTGPGWTSEVSAAYDRWLDPPEESDMTEEEIREAEIAAAEEKFEDMRDRGLI